MKKGDILGAVILFFFGGITTLLSLHLPLGTFRMAGTGLFPLCLGILLMLLSGLYLLRMVPQAWKSMGTKGTAEGSGSSRQLVLFLGIMILATLLFNLLGYLLISFFLMSALLRSLGVKRWVPNILISGVTAVASYFLFVQWLQIPLPRGFVGL